MHREDDMKKLNVKINNIAELVKNRNQQLLDHHMDKIDSITVGDENPSKKTSNVKDKIDPEFNKEIEEVHLPISKNTQIPTPNVILRSALFGIVKKGNRKYEKNVLKATFNGYTVKYSGEQLDQSDLDVWLECLQRCQSTPLGKVVKFTPNDFLISIGRSNGKSDYVWLNESLWRLRVNDVEISDGRYTYMGSLIFEQYRDEETTESCLILNPKIVVCFDDSGWTGITKSVRLQLKGKPLTQWIHGFYSSHSKPVPIKVETIRELSGSSIKELRMFRYRLKNALYELASVTGWNCYIDDADKVIISKIAKKI